MDLLSAAASWAPPQSLEEARARLRELEITEPELDDRQRNDFQDAMANVDEEYIQELLKKQGQGDDAGPAKKELRYTWSDMLSYRDQIGKGDAKIDQRLIRRFLKFLLDLWEIELAARPEEVRRTTEGRTASATLKQTINYIHPLFASLKSKTTEELVLNAVREIVIQMLSGEYIRANDAYLRFAIGNAPWPIGVTSVGIHSRTGREKIFAHNIAHVLNDETQRKYIQALKRLMTFCQNRFPSDPSKSLEFKVGKPRSTGRLFGGPCLHAVPHAHSTPGSASPSSSKHHLIAIGYPLCSSSPSGHHAQHGLVGRACSAIRRVVVQRCSLGNLSP